MHRAQIHPDRNPIQASDKAIEKNCILKFLVLKVQTQYLELNIVHFQFSIYKHVQLTVKFVAELEKNEKKRSFTNIPLYKQVEISNKLRG